MESASAAIVAAISFVVFFVFALLLMFTARIGWAAVFVGACIACVWVFALEWHDMRRRARQLKQPPFTSID